MPVINQYYFFPLLHPPFLSSFPRPTQYSKLSVANKMLTSVMNELLINHKKKSLIKLKVEEQYERNIASYIIFLVGYKQHQPSITARCYISYCLCNYIKLHISQSMSSIYYKCIYIFIKLLLLELYRRCSGLEFFKSYILSCSQPAL